MNIQQHNPSASMSGVELWKNNTAIAVRDQSALTHLSNELRLERAQSFLELNFSDGLSLDRLADVACLSKHHFKRLFKKRFGITPHRMLTRKRIEHAIALLANSSLNVNEITFAIGFEDTSSFIRLFKSTTGFTPLAFRKRSRKSHD